MPTPRPLALYVHIPFCPARCAYCDFNTYAGLEDLIPDYLCAVRREIERSGDRHGHPAAGSIYLGGGTPSLLRIDQLEALLTALFDSFRLADNSEVTLEANPGTIDAAYLHAAASLGVNRISLGIQSSHDSELALLGRIHSWDQARAAVSQARNAGLGNLNVDFIFGLPGQTLRRWEETLERALELGPEHISLYSLAVEQGTPLASQIAAGALPQPRADDAADMYELAEEILSSAGYFHYEIANWALRSETSGAAAATSEPWASPQGPGGRRSAAAQSIGDCRSEDFSAYVSHHNLVYWRNEEYLGFGAGATSRRDRSRRTNTAHPADYLLLVDGGRLVAEEEDISYRQEMQETMMLGLRLAEGVSDNRFRRRFHKRVADVFGDELQKLASAGLVAWDGTRARLTARGRLLGNQAFAAFV
jgi:oxygen-independent coproporphyrinogen-3 oxidase